jgi:hypothetical protein
MGSLPPRPARAGTPPLHRPGNAAGAQTERRPRCPFLLAQTSSWNERESQVVHPSVWGTDLGTATGFRPGRPTNQETEGDRALARSVNPSGVFPGVRTKIHTGYHARDFFTDSRSGSLAETAVRSQPARSPQVIPDKRVQRKLARDLSKKVRRVSRSGSYPTRIERRRTHQLTENAGRTASRRFRISIGGIGICAEQLLGLSVSGSRENIRGPSETPMVALGPRTSLEQTLRLSPARRQSS